jgi:hypothetical protein
MAVLSLVEVLAEVPDPRSRHGRIHPLPAILAFTAPSNAAAIRRLNNHPEEALALLDLPQL